MITYKVKLVGRKRPDIVCAEYFRIDEQTGVLTFRNASSKRSEPYPQFVKCYAQGVWTSVENVDALDGGKVAR